MNFHFKLHVGSLVAFLILSVAGAAICRVSVTQRALHKLLTVAERMSALASAVGSIDAVLVNMDDERQLPYPMVCLDMDGTMLNNEHVISKRTAATLNMLSASGVLVCVATGRSHNSVIQYIREGLDLSQPFVPVICFNGSMCMTVDTKTWETTTVFKDIIEGENLQKLIKMCSNNNDGDASQLTILQYYDGVSGDVNVASSSARTDTANALLKRYAYLTGKEQVRVASYEGLIEKGIYPVKCLVLTPETNVDRLLERARSTFSTDAFHIIRGSPHPFFVEFLKPGANKGTAVQRLCEHLNTLPGGKRFSIERTIAFGDGENDAEMLESVGMGVAMVNGRPLAKEAAKDVTTHSNHEDGVARYLESVFFV